MTGPISFSDYRARSHLLTLGFVYTFRSADRTTGETWANWERGGEGKLDVDVSREERVVSQEALTPYAQHSGFWKADVWADRIEDLHGDLDGAVYRVDLLRWRTA